MTAKVTLYSAAGCSYCRRAEALLRAKGVNALERIEVDASPAQLRRMIERSGRSSVPQIFIGDTHVGGFDELAVLERSGGLAALLAGASNAA